MPKIRCRYIDCIYLEDGFCGRSAIALDPDEGCMTYTRIGDLPADEAWEDEDLDSVWEDDELPYLEDEGDEDWLEEEETY